MNSGIATRVSAARVLDVVLHRGRSLKATLGAALPALADPRDRALVEAIQRKGVRVSVVSTVKSQPPMISDDLRRQADHFIDLADLGDVIGRPSRAPVNRGGYDNRTRAEIEADDEL